MAQDTKTAAVASDYKPRLLVNYSDEILPQLVEKFGYKNTMAVPRLQKIVLNMGVGKSLENPKLLDEAAKTAVVDAKGQGMAGIGSAHMQMISKVHSRGENETEVTIDADVTISGVLAQFGRGMIEQVSKKMFQEFTAAVKLELETD